VSSFLSGILLGVSHIDVAAEGGQAERGKAGWNLRVLKRVAQADRCEVAIEDLDGAGMEVGRVEVVGELALAKARPL